MVHLYFATCSRLLLFQKPSPSISCPLQTRLTTALPCDPGKIHNSLSFGHNTLYQIPPYFSHLSVSVWPSSESAPLPPPLHHHCPISASSLPWVPWPGCPLPVPNTHSVPRRAVGICRASLTTHPKQTLSASPDVSLLTGGDRHECPKPTLPVPPLPGQGPSAGNTGVGAAGICCHLHLPPQGYCAFGVHIPACFQWCFPSCHLVDKGDISNFLFHGRKSTWEYYFLIEEFG